MYYVYVLLICNIHLTLDREEIQIQKYTDKIVVINYSYSNITLDANSITHFINFHSLDRKIAYILKFSSTV